MNKEDTQPHLLKTPAEHGDVNSRHHLFKELTSRATGGHRPRVTERIWVTGIGKILVQILPTAGDVAPGGPGGLRTRQKRWLVLSGSGYRRHCCSHPAAPLRTLMLPGASCRISSSPLEGLTWWGADGHVWERGSPSASPIKLLTSALAKAMVFPVVCMDVRVGL